MSVPHAEQACLGCGTPATTEATYCGTCGRPLPRLTQVLAGSQNYRHTVTDLGLHLGGDDPPTLVTDPDSNDATEVGDSANRLPLSPGPGAPQAASPPPAAAVGSLGTPAPASKLLTLGNLSKNTPSPGRWMRGLFIGLIVALVLVLIEGGILIYQLSKRSVPAPAQATAIPTTPATATAPPSKRPLYQADWSAGPDGWKVGVNGWQVSHGVLYNDESYTKSIGTAPSIQVPSDPLAGVRNYAIEATIEVLGYGNSPGFGFFLGYANGNPPAGFIIGVSTSGTPLSVLQVTTATGWDSDHLATADFSPGAARHMYRIEVRGAQVGVFIDGVPLLTITTKGITGSIVGLWCAETRLIVSSFIITKLP